MDDRLDDHYFEDDFDDDYFDDDDLMMILMTKSKLMIKLKIQLMITVRSKTN